MMIIRGENDLLMNRTYNEREGAAPRLFAAIAAAAEAVAEEGVGRGRRDHHE